jgi:hypothetical protein
MSGIKSVLNQASRYSDSGVKQPKNWPPTYQDVMMRVKHTSDSVEYNKDHAEDHLAELISQLGKLAEVDRGKAQELAQKVCSFLDKTYKQVEMYKGQPEDREA